MAIHKFSLIAEFEYDDENGEYEVPKPAEIERRLASGMYADQRHLGLTDIHFEVAKGSLHTAFGIEEL